MKNKKRSKKYNPKKINTVVDRLALKNKIVTYVTCDDVNNLYCLKQDKKITVDRRLAFALSSQPFSWSVLIAVFCRDQTGKEYMKSEIIASNEKYFQHELIEFLNERHKALIKSVNKNHFIGVGWLASPEGKDFTEKQADHIFTKLGAFDLEKHPGSDDVYRLQEAS